MFRRERIPCFVTRERDATGLGERKIFRTEIFVYTCIACTHVCMRLPIFISDKRN